ncbi:MAG TPA: hypothetical protein VHO03_06585 [Ignavibacteriales bacterium]|nr:hypothetical protein [Ignavibacteriales bacterium]
MDKIAPAATESVNSCTSDKAGGSGIETSPLIGMIHQFKRQS